MPEERGFSSFSEVEAWLEEFTNTIRIADRKCREFRLDRMRAILDRLGNPQDSYSTIHIAGSKGKGSTAAYIARGLEGSGFRTGLYMSPHVTDCRERFTLCGRFFPESLLMQAANLMRSALEGLVFPPEYGEASPTTFEMYTAYALLLFKLDNCQWAVIETGMGGRLDATNVLVPKASVLTPIELEHTEVLGSTISLIAAEKSKIIKDNVPSFSAIQTSDARHVFEEEAKQRHSAITFLEDQLEMLETSVQDSGQKVSISFKSGEKYEMTLSIPGLVQAQNCALALLVLGRLGLLTEGSVSSMEGTSIPGRMESVKLQRRLILDGAHTENSVRQACSTFRQICPKGGVCIFGSVAGKKHEEMARVVLEAFDKVVIARPGTFKKSDPEALFSLFKSLSREGQKIVLAKEPQQAWQAAVELSSEDEIVLACGSFYLAGALKEVLCH